MVMIVHDDDCDVGDDDSYGCGGDGSACLG